MKIKNGADEAVTRGMLDGAVIKISETIDEKITKAVDGLAIMIGKGFAATTEDTSALAGRISALTVDISALTERMDHFEARLDAFEKKTDARFDAIFSELKEIRKEISLNHAKTKADIAALDFRVGKLEKKAGL